jgi:hypothetical protein
MRAQDTQLGNTANAAKVNEHPSRESQEGKKDAVVTRREFLGLAIATTLVAEGGHSAWAVETIGIHWHGSRRTSSLGPAACQALESERNEGGDP